MKTLWSILRTPVPKSVAISTPIFTLIFGLVLSACSTPQPTPFERAFANVQTNIVEKLVIQTNVVTIVQTNVAVVQVTNTFGVPIFVTNTVPVIFTVTNLLPMTTTVTQYVMSPNALAQGVAGAAGAASNLGAPGIGGLVSAGLLGALSIWLSYRNRQFAGQNDILTQSAGVLAQIIETGREVLSTTPQGQQAANAFTQWMVSHQAATGTIATISNIVKSATDNEQAQKAADQILALIQPGLPATQPPPPAKPA